MGFPTCDTRVVLSKALLADRYQLVAIDRRGNSRNDQPKRKENYDFERLVNDVATVVRQFPQEKATNEGHNLGGDVS